MFRIIISRISGVDIDATRCFGNVEDIQARVSIQIGALPVHGDEIGLGGAAVLRICSYADVGVVTRNIQIDVADNESIGSIASGVGRSPNRIGRAARGVAQSARNGYFGTSVATLAVYSTVSDMKAGDSVPSLRLNADKLASSDLVAR